LLSNGEFIHFYFYLKKKHLRLATRAPDQSLDNVDKGLARGRKGKGLDIALTGRG
jgi:hypothetical protein